MDEDYYKILGLARNASPADIQKAYRTLAKKHHPDLNPDDKTAKQRFQQIQKAYDVLGDQQKREMYDRYGGAFEGAGGFRPGGGAGFGGEDIDFGRFFGGGAGMDFSDLFRQFAGGAGPQPQPQQRGRPRRASARGEDLQHDLEVPFQTAVHGGEARLSVRRPNGTVESLEVKIPAGIEDGKKIRLRGQGEPGPRGGSAGDLLITVRIGSHPSFQRRGNNLEVAVPITLAEAVFGGKVDVPTPKGTITLTVPPGSSSGKRLRVKGHGIQPADGTPGDLFAELQIVLPETIDDDAKATIRRLTEGQADPRSNLRW